jgi:hypothetical protein
MDFSALIWSGIALPAAALLFYASIRRGLEWQLSKQAQQSSVASASGYVTLHGTALSAKPMRTAYSNKDCVYYRVRTEKCVPFSNGKYEWMAERDDERWVAFNIADETGQITVAADREAFRIPIRQRFEERHKATNVLGLNVSQSSEPVAEVKRFSDSFLSIGLFSLSPVGTKRHTEQYILTGEPITVVGFADNGLIGRAEHKPLVVTTEQKPGDILIRDAVVFCVAAIFFLAVTIILWSA